MIILLVVLAVIAVAIFTHMALRGSGNPGGRPEAHLPSGNKPPASVQSVI